MGMASGAAMAEKKGKSVLSVSRLAVGCGALTGLLWAYAIVEALKVSLSVGLSILPANERSSCC